MPAAAPRPIRRRSPLTGRGQTLEWDGRLVVTQTQQGQRRLADVLRLYRSADRARPWR